MLGLYQVRDQSMAPTTAHELPMGQPPEQVIREIHEHFSGDAI
jgi:hypothetical protein